MRVASLISVSGKTVRKRWWVKSAMGEDASGWRSMLFGVNTTSGLRQWPQGLAAQQMKILHSSRRLANLEIIPGRELQETFRTGARMFRSLAFVAVGRSSTTPESSPHLIFAGADELIDHRLRHVGEVAKLRFPHHQGLGIVPAVAILKSQYAGLG